MVVCVVSTVHTVYPTIQVSESLRGNKISCNSALIEVWEIHIAVLRFGQRKDHAVLQFSQATVTQPPQPHYVIITRHLRHCYYAIKNNSSKKPAIYS